MMLSKAQQAVIDELRERNGWLVFEPVSNRWWLWYRDGGFTPCRLINARTAQRLFDMGLIECNREKYGDSHYRLAAESESCQTS